MQWQRCAIMLSQGPQYVEVYLIPSHEGSPDPTVLCWGTFREGQNSVTNKADDGKFIAKGSGEGQTIWRFKWAEWKVEFVSRWDKSKELSPGNEDVAVTLRSAKCTERGIEPVGESGKAYMHTGGFMQMLSQGNTLDWRRKVLSPQESGL